MSASDAWTARIGHQFLPIGFVILGIVAAFVVFRLSTRRREKALFREREGVNEQTFTFHMQRYGLDARIASATYRHLQDVRRIPFPILPGDALEDDLGLSSEETQQTLAALARLLQRQPTIGLRSAPLVTVEDLVRLLQAYPRVKHCQAA